jgi:hypothetical protein
VHHQFTGIWRQLCGQTEAETVIKNNGLKGSPYPPIAAANDYVLAADFALNMDRNNPLRWVR